ncbi:MAG: two-component regulator propeller domain-containing protein, partial [Verrucomicrobiota bacterium]
MFGLAFADSLRSTLAAAEINGFSTNALPPPALEHLVDVWDTDSGLPHSTVTSVVQTPDGYLWIGTLFGGLARFDGVHFETFHPGNTPQLRSIEIERLLVDAFGTLWIGTVDGSVTSFRKGVFKQERQGQKNPGDWLWAYVGVRSNETFLATQDGTLLRCGLSPTGEMTCTRIPVPDSGANSIYCIDGDGAVWCRGGRGRLMRMQADRFEPVPTSGLRGTQFTRLLADHQGRVWVGSNRELALWNGEAFIDMTPTNGPAEIVVTDMVPVQDGGIWVRTPTSLRKCINRQWVVDANPWNVKFRPAPRSLAMHGDAEGGVWLAHYGDGLWHVDAKGRLERIAEAQGLPGGLVECWFQDRERNVWVGISGGGLVRLRRREFQALWPAEFAHDRAARSVCEDAAGAIWVGTSQDTLFQWRDGKFKTYSIPAEQSLGRDITVCADQAGRIWVGTVQNGIWLLDKDGLRRPFPSAAVGTVARALLADRAGRLWIGNEFGLYVWENEHLRKVGQQEGFRSAYILSIAEDKNGVIWTGTAESELRSFDSGKITNYKPDDDVGPVSMWSLLAEDDGTIWAGTLGGGLLRFREGRFTRYLVKDGLPDDNVSQLLSDDLGQLWAGSRAGIFRVAKSELDAFADGKIDRVNCHIYGKYDGLPTEECSSGFQPSCWRSRDGRLWFTTTKGVVSVAPEDIASNPLPPPVVIEKVLVDGQSAATGERSATSARGKIKPALFDSASRELRVKPGRHYFEIHVAGLSFVAPDKVRFKWRLAGLEKDWVQAGNRRIASYSFVPPGSYQFEVQACNNDGVWNTAGARMKLIVLPYFWQTWWFRAAIAILVSALLAVAYSNRVARLRQMARLRLRIARDLHDEVGANLGSISLLAQVMEKQPSAADASLVRQIAMQTIDTLRDVVWFIDPTHERLSDLVARLHETAKTMLRVIPYEFKQSGNFGSTELPLEFRRNVPPLFKEALNNVLKHSQATLVEISVRRSGDRFEFSILDNGVGLVERPGTSGNGLK